MPKKGYGYFYFFDENGALLEQESVIRRKAVYEENGRQRANRIVYVGEKPRLTGKELQIEKVCDTDNPLKLRDFRWEGYWRLANDEVFFNYEDYFGCDGTIPELNAKARRKKFFIVTLRFAFAERGRISKVSFSIKPISVLYRKRFCPKKTARL